MGHYPLCVSSDDLALTRSQRHALRAAEDQRGLEPPVPVPGLVMRAHAKMLAAEAEWQRFQDDARKRLDLGRNVDTRA